MVIHIVDEGSYLILRRYGHLNKGRYLMNYYKVLYGVASLRASLPFSELIMDLQKSKKFTRKHFKPVNSVDFMLTIREFFNPIGNDNYMYHVPDIEAIKKANFAKMGDGQKLKSITKLWKF